MLVCVLPLYAQHLGYASDIPSREELLVVLDVSRAPDGYSITSSRMTVITTFKPLSEAHDPAPGEWICRMHDVFGNIQRTISIPDPLLQRFEYHDEDGHIGSVTVALESNSLLLRFPYNPVAHYISVSRKIDAMQDELLVELTLSQIKRPGE
jgi:hypothetical protein